VGMQLAHAGRKGSTAPPNVAAAQKPPMLSLRADAEHGGWPDNVPGPTGGMAWSQKDGGRQYWPPRELSCGDIRSLVENFAQAARRSVEAGVDVIEIHSAHGYLLHQFLSPITNRRTDGYGGSFENRTRFLVEVINAIRSVIPAGMPLFLRVSATEWMEKSEIANQRGSWDEESTMRLAKLLPALGVDLLDVSSGGNCEEQSIQPHSGYQVEIAGRIRKMMKDADLKLLIGAVGLITEAEQARDIVEGSIEEEARVVKEMLDAKEGKEPLADVVLIARQFMRDPAFVLRVAAELDVKVAWPAQFRRVRFNTKKINKI
jgi:2,4-dienoyl-CoA reductase-like NADH-dependent reductase (Old Yellow Enzyme family)